MVLCIRYYVLGMKKAGFTLIEILIVMAILAMMAVIMVGILNPIALTGRGHDARRKKDLARIKVAFEEYFNDKKCFPTEATIAERGLRIKSNCGKGVFSPWLPIWPCDPNGLPYYIFVEQSSCPLWFKLITNLENKKDSDTPSGWYEYPDNYLVGDGNLNPNTANYGTSSTNVLWYERVARALPAYCGSFELGGGCSWMPPQGGCNSHSQYCDEEVEGHTCFVPTNDGSGRNCDPACQVVCCISGQSCE